MDNNEIKDLVDKATVGNLNAPFYERFKNQDAIKFVEMLKTQIENGKDISPRLVAQMLLDNFGEMVNESTISKWKHKVKNNLKS